MMKHIQFIKSIQDGINKGLIRKDPSYLGDYVWFKATGSFFMNNKEGRCYEYQQGDIVDLIIPKDRS